MAHSNRLSKDDKFWLRQSFRTVDSSSPLSQRNQLIAILTEDVRKHIKENPFDVCFCKITEILVGWCKRNKFLSKILNDISSGHSAFDQIITSSQTPTDSEYYTKSEVSGVVRSCIIDILIEEVKKYLIKHPKANDWRLVDFLLEKSRENEYFNISTLKGEHPIYGTIISVARGREKVYLV